MSNAAIAKVVSWGAVGAVLLIFMACGASGCYVIKPGEAAAEQTFGAARAQPVNNEGLHWHWPSPIGKTTVVQVRKSRTAEIGFQVLPEGQTGALTGEGWQRDYEAATMIAGDLNLLETQLVAHYQISNLNAYLFQADDPGVRFEYTDGKRTHVHDSHPLGKPDGQSIKDALEIAVRRSMGQKTIDQALVAERETIERETMEHAQNILNLYETGLTITSVQLQEVKPPDEVQAAFDDVLKAREEKDTRINQALAFESQTLPEARGQAERIRKEAVAYRAERINAAQGEADRFLAILKEYQASPEIIARRMYLETMDRVLPRTRQIMVTGDGAGPIILNMEPGRQTVVPVEQP